MDKDKFWAEFDQMLDPPASPNMAVFLHTRFMTRQADLSAIKSSSPANPSQQSYARQLLLIPVWAAAAVYSWIVQTAAAIAASVSRSIRFTILWICRLGLALLWALMVTGACVFGLDRAGRFLYCFATTTFGAIDHPKRSRKATIFWTALIMALFLLGAYTAFKPLVSAAVTAVRESYLTLDKAISMLRTTANITHATLQWIVSVVMWVLVYTYKVLLLQYKLAKLAWYHRGDLAYASCHLLFLNHGQATLAAGQETTPALSERSQRAHQSSSRFSQPWLTHIRTSSRQGASSTPPEELSCPRR
ncbi:MAG: hypothetical protein Q9173_005559 [Seirophora scorigena]